MLLHLVRLGVLIGLLLVAMFRPFMAGSYDRLAVPLSFLAAREIVVYNPLDEQTFTSHDGWILLLSPEALDRSRGYFVVPNAAAPHWRYFWFD